jgi:hypothetical protein
VDVIVPSEAALSYSPDADLTQEVMEEMNAIPVSFKLLTAEEPAPVNPLTPEKPAEATK